MVRPRPLSIVSSAVPAEHHQLTPRTPRSTGGSGTSRLEQGFTKLQRSGATEAEFDDVGALQSAPLLASPSTARQSARGRRTSESIYTREQTRNAAEMLSLAVSSLPLAIGILLGCLLLFLLVLSFIWPESLQRYIIGAKVNAATPSSYAGHEVDTIHLSSNNHTIPPLHPIEYAKACAKMHVGYMTHGDYWDDHVSATDAYHPSDDPSVCSKTITYMLDGTVGLTADLALMAQAAALARERNRTFLVDDTYWNRGKWTDHFEDVREQQPGPQPGCKPAPAEQLVACPRTARHWVINSRTAKFHFGHEFSNHYEDPYAHELNRLRPIFISARQSLTSTIVPNAANKDLIAQARHGLHLLLHAVDSIGNPLGSTYVSTHIRRGDRKTLSYSFPNRRVPIQNYVDAIKSTWSRLYSNNRLPIVYLATDSPDAYQKFEQLYEGLVFSLFDNSDPRLRELASPGEYYQTEFDKSDLKARITATRGMIVDLALLSGLWPSRNDLNPDAVICALSSNVCRLAPIGLGWEEAFGHVDQIGNIDQKGERWIDVDEKGLILPVWEAFELF